MGELFAVAMGGAFGAVIRFLISNGLHVWLGRGFPYGTLVVNVVGSFLLGLLSQALSLHKMAFTIEYRAAILVGFIGALTTFSTFSLETCYLFQQGQINKAFLNIAINLLLCLFAVWLGLHISKLLLGIDKWRLDVLYPYSIFIINAIGALLISIIGALLLQKVLLNIELQLLLIVTIIGVYLLFSGLYVLLYLLEHGVAFSVQEMLKPFVINTCLCLLVMWCGTALVKQFFS